MATNDIEVYARAAIVGAQRRGDIKSVRIIPKDYSPRPVKTMPSDDDLIERATIRAFAFKQKMNQLILYMLRLMEMRQVWRRKGYDSLNSWAYARLERYADRDKLSRYCAITMKVIAPLDAVPEISEDGEKITGLLLIQKASTSALMKTAGLFLASDNGDRTSIARILLSGTSNERAIKAVAGWAPTYGKADARWEFPNDDEFILTIHGRRVHQHIIENRIGYLLDPHYTE